MCDAPQFHPLPTEQDSQLMPDPAFQYALYFGEPEVRSHPMLKVTVLISMVLAQSAPCPRGSVKAAT